MPRKKQTTIHQKGNPIANNPLMRKGGVHKKSQSSKRQKHKRETRRLVAKYMGATRDRYRRVGGSGGYFSKRLKKHGEKLHTFFVSGLKTLAFQVSFI
jgi:hypothetical protein